MATNNEGLHPSGMNDMPRGTTVHQTATHYPEAAPVRTGAGVAPVEPVRFRASWSAVLAGVIMALSVQLLFTLIGTAIGMSTVDPASAGGVPSAKAFSIGAGIWWAITSLLSLFIGGWTTGRLAGLITEKDSILHGLLMWGVTTILTAYLLSSAISGIVGTVGRAAGTVAQGAGQAISSVAPQIADQVKDQAQKSGIDLSSVQNEVMKTLRQTGKPELQPEAAADRAKGVAEDAKGTAADAAKNPDTANMDINSLWNRFVGQGKDMASKVDKEAMANVVASRTGVSKEEAMATVDKWDGQVKELKAKAEQQAEEAKQKAKEAADAAASATSKGALWAFLALALGAVAAALGGRMGSRGIESHRTATPATAGVRNVR